MTTETPRPRRVVISPGDDSAVVEETELDVSVDTPRTRITEVWSTSTDGEFADHAPTDPWQMLPPSLGTTWRIVEFKPTGVETDLTAGMHATPTVDIGVVLSGEVLLVLEDGRPVPLRTGDHVVLRGIQHTWANTGTEPCVLAMQLVRSSE